MIIKWILKFLLWYVLMWLFAIPISWYFIVYFKTDFEYTDHFFIVTNITILLLATINHSFGWFIWKQIRFIYDILIKIDELKENYQLKKLRSRKYVYIKKEKNYTRRIWP
jgi:hypothetical protein